MAALSGALGATGAGMVHSTSSGPLFPALAGASAKAVLSLVLRSSSAASQGEAINCSLLLVQQAQGLCHLSYSFAASIASSSHPVSPIDLHFQHKLLFFRLENSESSIASSKHKTWHSAAPAVALVRSQPPS
jgi:hypothetical protein